MKYKILGIVLILIGLLVAGTVLYRNSQKRRQSIVFSPKLMLSALWNSYKTHYWEAETGRTVDRQRNNITTSEGQSYTMLRAVWQDDKATFDKSWQWTRDNLKRPNDHLFAWLYGQRADGSYGILTDQGGGNTATDADTDIALALLFAGSRWQDQQYAASAKSIITDIWANEVVVINGVPYLTANNVEKFSANAALINPSYLAPYAYRIFAQADPAHDWNAVVDSSYEVLQQSSAGGLGSPVSSGLPPDWVAISKSTGQLQPPANNTLTTDYGFDALRVPFRIALDWQWNRDERAKNLLDRFYFLDQEWHSKNLLNAVYAHDGQVVSTAEVAAMYGGSIGYFMSAKPQTAADVYNNKLKSLYSPDFQDWRQPMNYYDDNWAWFGLALYNQELPNLFYLPSAGLRGVFLVTSGRMVYTPADKLFNPYP